MCVITLIIVFNYFELLVLMKINNETLRCYHLHHCQRSKLPLLCSLVYVGTGLQYLRK